LAAFACARCSDCPRYRAGHPRAETKTTEGEVAASPIRRAAETVEFVHFRGGLAVAGRTDRAMSPTRGPDPGGERRSRHSAASRTHAGSARASPAMPRSADQVVAEYPLHP